MSPEFETLDQLLGGDLSLRVVLRFYPDEGAFLQGVLGLLRCGDVRLLASDQTEVPHWRRRELFVDGKAMNTLADFKLEVTDQGASRVI